MNKMCRCGHLKSKHLSYPNYCGCSKEKCDCFQLPEDWEGSWFK